jgi:hypothetical protein
MGAFSVAGLNVKNWVILRGLFLKKAVFRQTAVTTNNQNKS